LNVAENQEQDDEKYLEIKNMVHDLRKTLLVEIKELNHAVQALAQ
jgi:hypothetical protein